MVVRAYTPKHLIVLIEWIPVWYLQSTKWTDYVPQVFTSNLVAPCSMQWQDDSIHLLTMVVCAYTPPHLVVVIEQLPVWSLQSTEIGWLCTMGIHVQSRRRCCKLETCQMLARWGPWSWYVHWPPCWCAWQIWWMAFKRMIRELTVMVSLHLMVKPAMIQPEW